jgi:hypothetical protein
LWIGKSTYLIALTARLFSKSVNARIWGKLFAKHR